MFTDAIVRTPCKSIINGITTSNEGEPDYIKSINQHKLYINALKKSGLEVTVLPEKEIFPDSTFVEDVALLTPNCAIITRPGAELRQKETKTIKSVLFDFYDDIKIIKSPGTVDAGDIMMVGNHFYIGLSERTNKSGAEQVISILNKYDMTASTIKLSKMLHLKSGVAYLENNNMVVSGEFIDNPEFKNFNLIKIDDDEKYAANCVWINNYVFVAKNYPRTKQSIEKAGYETIELDMSEFRKLDGGLSCLSLRF